MIKNKYWFIIDGKAVPNEEAMLSKLLDDDVLFCNSRQYVCKFVGKIKEETIVLYINVNDCFCPASDAEGLTLTELPKLFQLYEDKEHFGIIEFVALKRKQQPRKSLKSKMIIANFWTPELEMLPANSF